MSRTKKFLHNSLSTACLQIVVMIVGFITPRILLKYYGSEINGLVSSINQFISYFNIVEAGLAVAATYALYVPLATSDHGEINSILVAAKRFYTKSGYMFVSLTVCLAILYPLFIKSSVLSPLYVGLLVLIIGFNGALEFFTLAKYRVLLTADQKTYIISIASILQIILNTVIICGLSMFRINIVLIRAIALLAVFLRSFILLVYVRSKYRYLDYAVPPNYQALNKRWDALYLQLLGSTQTGGPIIIATFFTNLQSVSIYAIYNMVISGISGVLSIFTSGLSASFGDVIARGEKKTLQKAHSEFEFTYYNLITFIYAVAMVTILPFIKIFTNDISDINYSIPIIGYLFVLNGWLYNVKTPQGMLIISAGLYKETRIQSTIQTLILIILGVILTINLGLIGVLIASCLSNLYRDIDLIIFVPKKITMLPIKNTVMRVLSMIIQMYVINIPFAFIEYKIVTFWQWMLFAFIVSVYAIFILLIFNLFFNKTQMLQVMDRVKSMAVRRRIGELVKW